MGFAAAKLVPQLNSEGFRIAHLTDIHIRPGRVPEEGFAQALEHAQAQGAQLIINGGDAIFDAAATEPDMVKIQWNLFRQILGKYCSVPVLHTVGNHDILGWSTPNRDPQAKLFTLRELVLDNAYYSRELAGWKLIVLDSIQFSPDRLSGYRAALDEKQFEWLAAELASTSNPVCIVSHVPILSPATFFDGPNERSGKWVLPGEWMHVDARRLKDLFFRHPQVKLCLSGHVHLADRVDYLGVSYFCNGAVSGDYWRSTYQEFEPAYALVDLFPDGSFEHRLVVY